MISPEYSTLLPLIYESALDSSKWDVFCDEYYRLLGSPIQLTGHDFCKNQSLGLISAGYDKSLDVQFHDHYAQLNPWMHMNVTMPQGAIGFSDQALPREKLLETEFYNDWLKPQGGLIGGYALMAFRDSNCMIALTSAASKRFEASICEKVDPLLNQIAPHLTRSIELSRALALDKDNTQGNLTAQLYNSRYAIFTVRASGLIAWKNLAGENLLRIGRALRSSNNYLTSRHSVVEDWIRKCHLPTCDKQDKYTAEPIVLNCLLNGKMVLHWHKICTETTETYFPDVILSDPIVGMLVACGKTGLNSERNIHQIACSFGATPSEAKLAAALISGISLYEYAERQCISKHTVRNQMRALLAKAGVRNQQEFILLALKYQSPFSNLE